MYNSDVLHFRGKIRGKTRVLPCGTLIKTWFWACITTYRKQIRPLKINCAVWVRNFLKSYERARQNNACDGKKRETFSDIIIRQAQVYVRGILCGIITLYDILSLLWLCGQDNASYSCMVWWTRICSWRGQCPTINQMDECEKLNMKYNAHVFLQVSAKGTSEVTQTAQFILRGLIHFPLIIINAPFWLVHFLDLPNVLARTSPSLLLVLMSFTFGIRATYSFNLPPR